MGSNPDYLLKSFLLYIRLISSEDYSLSRKYLSFLLFFSNQALNLVVVIFCIYFTNSFLDGTFNDLGYKWMEAYLRTDEVL